MARSREEIKRVKGDIKEAYGLVREVKNSMWNVKIEEWSSSMSHNPCKSDYSSLAKSLVSPNHTELKAALQTLLHYPSIYVPICVLSVGKHISPRMKKVGFKEDEFYDERTCLKVEYNRPKGKVERAGWVETFEEC
eukprot:CAMPEP_0118640160 /NCGR_PEP_ID=MMETSP0785-20121206/4606_1 /TAXON_ID=91992 /ORGANISM="Bolidomonas pacifica, Strain CCMP 1866" /LENGTH=135 /DNA_ID=CAMNT_0006531531 /DNA_START=8 /DNA_END=412 /DNA_ORIENTATION=+